MLTCDCERDVAQQRSEAISCKGLEVASPGEERRARHDNSSLEGAGVA